jgi:hypothetical protein
MPNILTPSHPSPLTGVRLRATLAEVRIRNFVHKGLKKLYEDDVTKGLPPDAVDKLRKMLAFPLLESAYLDRGSQRRLESRRHRE